MSSTVELAVNFNTYAQTKLSDSLRQIEKCLNLLSLEQVWHRPNDVSNAIGNLVLHLAGNVRQWIIASLGGESFARDRAAEFAQCEPLSTDEILKRLRQTVERACDVIGGLSPDALSARVTIQGYNVTGLEAVFHVVEHFSLHTGQIVYATKLLINQDLSAYDTAGRRLDGRASGTP